MQVWYRWVEGIQDEGGEKPENERVSTKGTTDGSCKQKAKGPSELDEEQSSRKQVIKLSARCYSGGLNEERMYNG